MTGKLYIADAPSGGGKTLYLKGLVRKAREEGKSAVYAANGQLFDSFKETLEREGLRYSIRLEKLLEEYDLYAVDDIDVFLHNRDAVQCEFAHIVYLSLREGKTVYIAGTDLQSEAKTFLETLKKYWDIEAEWIAPDKLCGGH